MKDFLTETKIQIHCNSKPNFLLQLIRLISISFWDNHTFNIMVTCSYKIELKHSHINLMWTVRFKQESHEILRADYYKGDIKKVNKKHDRFEEALTSKLISAENDHIILLNYRELYQQSTSSKKNEETLDICQKRDH